MIESKDLRIGNCVNTLKGMGFVVEVTDKLTRTAYLRHVSVTRRYTSCNNQYTLRELNPVQLTPEILAQIAGIQKYKDNDGNEWYCLNYGDFEFTQCDKNGYTDVYIEVNNPIEGAFEIKRCRYLHELQNVWYYLTGSELKIKAMTGRGLNVQECDKPIY